jgi:hypothetical protein
VFLELVMRKMGFDEKWVGLVMSCVTSINYSIIINRKLVGLICPSRGIRPEGSLFHLIFSCFVQR